MVTGCQSKGPAAHRSLRENSWARMNGMQVLQFDTGSGASATAYNWAFNADAFAAGLRSIDLSGDTNATGINTLDASRQTSATISLQLNGSAGADSITGGSGNDTLNGG